MSSSLGGRPVAARRRRAEAPSCSHTRRQRRTLSAHTPTTLAISAFETPRSNNSTARTRRLRQLRPRQRRKRGVGPRRGRLISHPDSPHPHTHRTYKKIIRLRKSGRSLLTGMDRAYSRAEKPAVGQSGDSGERTCRAAQSERYGCSDSASPRWGGPRGWAGSAGASGRRCEARPGSGWEMMSERCRKNPGCPGQVRSGARVHE